MRDRPLSIAWFDRAYLTSTVLSVIIMIGSWEYWAELDPGDPQWIEYVIIGLTALTYVLTIVLWALIVNHRSKVAKWILTVLTCAALPLYFLDDGADLRPVGWVYAEVGSVILGLAALVGLFTPTANRWFRWEKDALAETFS